MTLPPGPAARASAPGRVNLIGEHLDYNGGACLPIALDRRTTVTVRPALDGQLSIRSGGLEWSGLPTERAEGWAAYVAGVLSALEVRTPLTLEVASDVPIGAGLSSSAALTCATALAVDALLGLGATPDQLAQAAIRAENEYVGAPTGGMDQAIALHAAAGRALLLDFSDATRTAIPWRPERDGLVLLVIDVGVSHRLADGAYAQRRRECELAAAHLGVPLLARADPRSLPDLPAELLPRARHVVTEQARVGALARSCAEADWTRVGALMSESHASLRDDFAVSCAELDTAVITAERHGALGARMTGAGFGGSAIALAPAVAAAEIERALARAFAARSWEAPTVFAAEAARGAEVAGQRLT